MIVQIRILLECMICFRTWNKQGTLTPLDKLTPPASTTRRKPPSALPLSYVESTVASTRNFGVNLSDLNGYVPVSGRFLDVADNLCLQA